MRLDAMAAGRKLPRQLFAVSQDLFRRLVDENSHPPILYVVGCIAKNAERGGLRVQRLRLARDPHTEKCDVQEHHHQPPCSGHPRATLDPHLLAWRGIDRDGLG